MTHTFNVTKNLVPWRSGITTQEVYDILTLEPGAEVTVKEILGMLVKDWNQEDLKDVSNRCVYLSQKGLAERTGKGTYRAIENGQVVQKGKAMTTDTPTSAFASATAAPPTAEPASTPATPGEFDCPHCGFEARSEMGLKAHVTRSHAKNKPLTADQAFERIGMACEMLFPDGLPMARVIEIAELQKAMLKVMTR